MSYDVNKIQHRRNVESAVKLLKEQYLFITITHTLAKRSRSLAKAFKSLK